LGGGGGGGVGGGGAQHHGVAARRLLEVRADIRARALDAAGTDRCEAMLDTKAHLDARRGIRKRKLPTSLVPTHRPSCNGPSL